jgi:phosphatidylglycerol:prolipoprotein diacylglycerol transferase
MENGQWKIIVGAVSSGLMFESFEIGPVIIWMRLVFLLLAVWISLEFFLRLAASASLSIQSVKDYARWHLLAFVLMGRVMAILGDYQSYEKDWLRTLIFWDGNFSFIGGAIGIAIVLFFATRTQRATYLQWLDVLFPATSFGLALDWIGMFLSSQDYGKPTNVPWAITVDTFNVRYTVPIHPVQLYYAIFFFLLTFVLLMIRKYSKRAGAETLIGIIAASIVVFLFEYLRGDFAIPVFALLTDFIFLGSLIASLGVLALLEQRLSERTNLIYGSVVGVLTISYVIARPWIDLPQYQLRFSQVLAILALLATVVYVVVHRRKYPHL